MSVYGPSPIKGKPRLRRTKAELEELDRALARIVAEIKPATVRQTFYQAVVRGLVLKTRASFPVWLEDALRQAELSSRDQKTPIMVLHQDGKKYQNALVACRLSEFANPMGGER